MSDGHPPVHLSVGHTLVLPRGIWVTEKDGGGSKTRSLLDGICARSRTAAWSVFGAVSCVRASTHAVTLECEDEKVLLGQDIMRCNC